ncbi:unnamed protein product [Rhizoctonia solani]|uniref:Uncharacterized protein n=1 Tax=Rhizoctonia solani TaxID=456999 RepID=A0A8H3DY02_9AGAM|nr:unnamed protein product [Rhizoctonia solani]
MKHLSIDTRTRRTSISCASRWIGDPTERRDFNEYQVSSIEDLIENISVVREEKVGVDGFIFYRDSGWVDVTVDDLLYISIPNYEQLLAKAYAKLHGD